MQVFSKSYQNTNWAMAKNQNIMHGVWRLNSETVTVKPNASFL